MLRMGLLHFRFPTCVLANFAPGHHHSLTLARGASSSLSSSWPPQGPASQPAPQRPGLAGGFTSIQYMNDADSVDAKPQYRILHVHASSNNTIVSLSNAQGDVMYQSSGGIVGYKKSMRSGFEPAYKATKSVLDALESKLGDQCKLDGLVMKFKGFGPGKEAAWKCVQTFDWKVVMVEDVTPIPHGGCRPKKRRRL